MNADVDYILEKRNVLDKEFCKRVIDKFERDTRKRPGVTISGPAPDTKISEDLRITDNLNDNEEVSWSEEIKVFDKVLQESYIDWIQQRKEYFLHKFDYNFLDFDNIMLKNETGYQIQKTVGGEGFYNWHHDYWLDSHGNRALTFIIYLNDVPGPGGETQFISGRKVTPEEGKVLIFPALWTHYHRGICPPKGSNKYIMTGWWCT